MPLEKAALEATCVAPRLRFACASEMLFGEVDLSWQDAGGRINSRKVTRKDMKEALTLCTGSNTGCQNSEVKINLT